MKKGFTLAEVLITLGIIGIIAALTMPTLVVKYQEKTTVTKVKKMYSVVSQAYLTAINENGEPSGWGLTQDVAGAEEFLNTLAPYLNIAKNCGSGCFPDGVVYKTLAGTDWGIPGTNNWASAILSDGIVFDVMIFSADCTDGTRGPDLQEACGFLRFDVNGSAPPNQFGRDFFQLIILSKRILPIGLPGDGYADKCNLSGHGYGCGAWVIYNENMDYLHCDNLSWDGPTKCN